MVPQSLETTTLCKPSHNPTQDVGCNKTSGVEKWLPCSLHQRPDVGSWGTDLQAIVIALELEKGLHKHLQDLKSLASKNSETDVS